MVSRNKVLIGLVGVAAIGLAISYSQIDKLDQNNWKTVVSENGTTIHGIGTTFIGGKKLDGVNPYLSFTCKNERLTAMVQFTGNTLSSDVYLENPYAEKIDIAFGRETGFYMEVSVGEYQEIRIVRPDELIFHMKQTQKMYDNAEDFQVITNNEDGMSMVAHFDVSDIEKVEEKMGDAGCVDKPKKINISF